MLLVCCGFVAVSAARLAYPGSPPALWKRVVHPTRDPSLSHIFLNATWFRARDVDLLRDVDMDDSY